LEQCPSSGSAIAEAPEPSKPQTITTGIAITEVLELRFFIVAFLLFRTTHFTTHGTVRLSIQWCLYTRSVDPVGGTTGRETGAGDVDHGVDHCTLVPHADGGRGRDVWRIAAAGGATTRITKGGIDGGVCESADGTRLFYTHHSALMTVPAAGGSERQVIECVKGGAITVGPSGIYYAACSHTFELESALHVMDPDTHRDRLLGTLKDYWVQLAVSPDERTILYRKVANRGLHGKYSVGTDLMLIENFR